MMSVTLHIRRAMQPLRRDQTVLTIGMVALAGPVHSLSFSSQDRRFLLPAPLESYNLPLAEYRHGNACFRVAQALPLYASACSTCVAECLPRTSHFVLCRGDRHFCSPGGVAVSAANGRIVCDNTLSSRLTVIYQELLPKIRGLLFPASA